MSRASRIFLRKFVLHLHFVFASQAKITAAKKTAQMKAKKFDQFLF